MTDFPRRLLEDDDAPAHVRHAVARARVDEPDLARLEKALRRVGRDARGRRPRSTVSTVAACALALTGIAIAVGMHFGSSSAPSTPALETPPHAELAPETKASSTVSSLAPSVSVADLPTVTPSPRETSAPRATAPASSLARELELLRTARRKLDEGATLAALEEVARHQREFPNGVLRPEIDVTRIDALFALGRTEEARAKGKEFVRRYPSSPQTPRIRARLEDSP